MDNLHLDTKTIITILREHNLLTSFRIASERPTTFTNISYDSRNVGSTGLFFCKGNFKPAYLADAEKNGAVAYISESDLGQSNLTCFVVKDIQKAMSLLSAAFYGYPQDDLFIIAFTGTKGKTTSAYFTRSILKRTTNNLTALSSTIDTYLSPDDSQKFKSKLTTPESMDLFRNMRTAVDNGMTHLVIEVSSQAYKKNRVYGLHFDVGFFLNISPDHIGVNEHPTFADYLHCKEQLLVNSTVCVINSEMDYFKDVYYAAKATSQPQNIYLFAREGTTNELGLKPDITFKSLEDDLTNNEIAVTNHQSHSHLPVDGIYHLAVPGDYNESNATAAIIAASLAGASLKDSQEGLSHVNVPGRMERHYSKNHGTIYVDYAHNYASMHALLGFLKKENPDGQVIVVLGSTGDKGEDRRKGFGKALNEKSNEVFLTTDDPGDEDPIKIAQEIDSYIDHDKVKVHFEMDRQKAIREAISAGKPKDTIVIAGKGLDPYQKINGVDVPYPTDSKVVQNFLKGNE